jgi:hypothetical protein
VVRLNHVRIVRFTWSFLVETPMAAFRERRAPSNTAAYLTFGPGPSREYHSQGGSMVTVRWLELLAERWSLWPLEREEGKSAGDLA